MATRSIPYNWFITNGPTITNIVIVNFNPHDTICPLCWQFIGRVYTYYPGAPYPPPLPLHQYCYCWYEITEEPATVLPWTPLPTPVPGPPPLSDPPWAPLPTPVPGPPPFSDPPWASLAATPAVYPEPEEPEEPGYPGPGTG